MSPESAEPPTSERRQNNNTQPGGSPLHGASVSFSPLTPATHRHRSLDHTHVLSIDRQVEEGGERRATSLAACSGRWLGRWRLLPAAWDESGSILPQASRSTAFGLGDRPLLLQWQSLIESFGWRLAGCPWLLMAFGRAEESKSNDTAH